MQQLTAHIHKWAVPCQPAHVPNTFLLRTRSWNCSWKNDIPVLIKAARTISGAEPWRVLGMHFWVSWANLRIIFIPGAIIQVGIPSWALRTAVVKPVIYKKEQYFTSYHHVFFFSSIMVEKQRIVKSEVRSIPWSRWQSRLFDSVLSVVIRPKTETWDDEQDEKS